MKLNCQKGEGRLGLFVALVVVGVAIFVGAKIIPVKISAYEFRDVLREECRFAALHQSNTEVAERILDKAKSLEIPLQAKDLELMRTKSEMVIRVKYEKPIDLKFTTYVYRFNAKEKAPIF